MLTFSEESDNRCLLIYPVIHMNCNSRSSINAEHVTDDKLILVQASHRLIDAQLAPPGESNYNIIVQQQLPQQ